MTGWEVPLVPLPEMFQIEWLNQFHIFSAVFFGSLATFSGVLFLLLSSAVAFFGKRSMRDEIVLSLIVMVVGVGFLVFGLYWSALMMFVVIMSLVYIFPDLL